MNLSPARELWSADPFPTILPGLTPKLVPNLLTTLAQAPSLPWGVLLWVPDLAALGLVAGMHLLAPAVRLLLALPPDPGICQEADDIEMAALLSAAHLAQELPLCLEKLDRGHRFLSGHVPLARLAVAVAPAGLATLTLRELEVLALVACGLTNSQQIADLLHVSPRTIDAHKDSLMDKLGLSGRCELYWYAGLHQASILASTERLGTPVAKYIAKIGKSPS
jgi:DNA-binding CsgD family transcriptional regulator